MVARMVVWVFSVGHYVCLAMIIFRDVNSSVESASNDSRSPAMLQSKAELNPITAKLG